NKTFPCPPSSTTNFHKTTNTAISIRHGNMRITRGYNCCTNPSDTKNNGTISSTNRTSNPTITKTCGLTTAETPETPAEGIIKPLKRTLFPDESMEEKKRKKE
ncbi:hypothetical protein Tco_1300206, partial [Tanacetum coccineum]